MTIETNQNKFDRTRRAWDVLAKVAGAGKKITYAELGEAIGIHHRVVTHALGHIQNYCLDNNLPPLTILVVSKKGIHGSGFIAQDPNNLEAGFADVWNYTWEAMRNPFDFSKKGYSTQDIVDILVKNPNKSEEIYKLTKDRGIQQIIFRAALLTAYQSKCAFTSLEFEDCLEACHIVPWANSNAQQRMDIRNGILLTPLHHKFFDKGYITITPDYTIKVYDHNEKSKVFCQFEREALSSLHNKKMNLPTNHAHYPSAENIKFHNTLGNWDEKLKKI